MPYSVKIELESLLKEINQVVRASSIYLFGSYAYGEPTEDSDLDICIVTDDKSKRKVEIMKLIRKAIAKVTGINEAQLTHYANGFRKPRPLQKRKIVEGIHQLGRELMSIE